MAIFGVALRRPSMARLRLPTFCALLALSIDLTACGSQRGNGGGSPAEASWVVTIGSEGGFTGGGSGYRLYADGRVESWKRLTTQAAPESTLLGRASRQAVERFHEALAATAPMDSATSVRGNMTAFLDWREGQLRKRYTWVEGETPATPVATAYEAAMEIVRSLQRNE